MGLLSLTPASAQTLGADELPTRSVAARIVHEIKAILPFTTEAPASAKDGASASASYNAAFGESVVQTALQYIGARYRLGHTGPKSFDCSGFTSYVFRKANVRLLRDSRSQYTQGAAIAATSDLKKGDLVFFGGRGNTRRVGHVGIVTDVDPESGRFKFVHASNSGVKVSASDESYYRRRYIGARRIIAD